MQHYPDLIQFYDGKKQGKSDITLNRSHKQAQGYPNCSFCQHVVLSPCIATPCTVCMTILRFSWALASTRPGLAYPKLTELNLTWPDLFSFTPDVSQADRSAKTKFLPWLPSQSDLISLHCCSILIYKTGPSKFRQPKKAFFVWIAPWPL